MEESQRKTLRSGDKLPWDLGWVSAMLKLVFNKEETNVAKEMKVKRGTARRAKRVGIPTKGSEQRAEWDKAKVAKTTQAKE